MIKTTMLETEQIAIFKLIDKCEINEILDVTKTIYPNIGHGAIWDITEGDISEFTPNEMSLIAQCSAGHTKHKKTALVGANDLNFGILRMYEAYAMMNLVPATIRTFRKTEDALNWIRE